MSVRRLSAGLVAAALFTPGLAACNATGTSQAGSSASPTVAASGTASGAAPAVPGDPKQALLASTREISNGNFRFTMSGAGSTAEGQVHEPSQSAQMRVTVGAPTDDLFMKLDLIHAKPDSWVKVELGGKTAGNLPAVQKLNLGKYQHLDQTRIKGNRSLAFDFDQVDPAGSEVLTQGITEVRQTGEGTYAGTLDVSKAAQAGSVDPAVITALGAQAKSVPFTAKLDPQGRLSEMVIQLPTAGQSPAPAGPSQAPAGPSQAQEIRITYSDYGNASAAQKPPADQVVEAPPEFYNLFK